MSAFAIDILTGKAYLFAGSSIGGKTYTEVSTFNELPDPTLHPTETYIVSTSSGIYLINRKEAGLYYSNGVSWSRLGNIPSFFNSNNFQIYDGSDNTKIVKFVTSGITTNNTRNLNVQDSDGTIALLRDVDLKVDKTTYSGYTATTAPNTFLKLDQTTPQIVSGGTPQFETLKLNEHNNTTPSTGDLWFTGDSLTFNNGSKSFELTPSIEANPNYITVDKEGYGNYTTFAAAINSIPTGGSEQYLINFVANTYVETSQIIIPDNTTINFNGSIIYFVGVVDDCILIQDLDRIKLNGGYLLTSTGHTNALVGIYDSDNTLLENMFFLEGNIGLNVEMFNTGNTNLNYLNLVKFFTGITTGIVGKNTNGLTFIDVENQAKTGLDVINSTDITGSGGGYRNNSVAAVHAKKSSLLLNGISIRDTYDAIHLDSGSTINGGSIVIEDSVRYDIWQEDVDSIVDVTNSKLDQYKLNIINWSNFNADYDNDREGERAYHYNKDVHFGSPEYPREIVAGEGNSIGRDTLVYTYNASTSGYTNVSSLVATDSSTGNTMQFPNDGPDNALYFSSNIVTKDGDYYKHYGLRSGLLELGAKGTGDYIYEYWNGSEWKNFNRLITDREAPYTPYGNNINSYTGSTPHIFQVRYDSGILDDWTKNDPIGSGIDRYWTRIRITATIDAPFINYSLKLHTNRTEINGDGFMEYFGNARPLKKLELQYNSFEPAINSPTDQNLFYSKGLYAGRIQNLFAFNKKDSVGYLAFLPYDIDTSSELVFKIAYAVNDSSAGNIYYGLNWGVISNNDEIFFSEASAPISASTENNVSGPVSVPANTQNKIKNFTIGGIKIPDAIARKQDGTTDIVVFTLYRDGTDVTDTYDGDAIVIDIAVYYEAWCDGGHADIL